MPKKIQFQFHLKKVCRMITFSQKMVSEISFDLVIGFEKIPTTHTPTFFNVLFFLFVVLPFHIIRLSLSLSLSLYSHSQYPGLLRREMLLDKSRFDINFPLLRILFYSDHSNHLN